MSSGRSGLGRRGTCVLTESSTGNAIFGYLALCNTCLEMILHEYTTGGIGSRAFAKKVPGLNTTGMIGLIQNTRSYLARVKEANVHGILGQTFRRPIFRAGAGVVGGRAALSGIDRRRVRTSWAMREKGESRWVASCRASKESTQLRSMVKPEHQCHDEIPVFQYNMCQPREEIKNRITRRKVGTHRQTKTIPSNRFDLSFCTT